MVASSHHHSPSHPHSHSNITLSLALLILSLSLSLVSWSVGRADGLVENMYINQPIRSTHAWRAPGRHLIVRAQVRDLTCSLRVPSPPLPSLLFPFPPSPLLFGVRRLKNLLGSSVRSAFAALHFLSPSPSPSPSPSLCL